MASQRSIERKLSSQFWVQRDSHLDQNHEAPVLLPTGYLYSAAVVSNTPKLFLKSLKVLIVCRSSSRGFCFCEKAVFNSHYSEFVFFVLSDCFRTNQRLRRKPCLTTVCWKTSTLMRSSWEKKMWQKVRCPSHEWQKTTKGVCAGDNNESF